MTVVVVPGGDLTVDVFPDDGLTGNARLREIIDLFFSAPEGAVITKIGTSLSYQPPGTGTSAGSVVSSAIAGEALSGDRAVVLNSSGQAVYASNTTPGHATRVIGITTGAAILGALVSIQSFGEYTESTWSWVPNNPIFLSSNGSLTQTPPVSGFLLIVATAITATKIFINIQSPILR